MQNVNYTLIGTIPEMESFRDSLPALIVEYEANRPSKEEKDELIAKFKLFKKIPVFSEMMSSQISRGVAIEMCATHFYGLDPMEFESMPDLIDAIKGCDEELNSK